MDFLAGMEFDLFVPSFPELQAEFDLTPFWVEALLSVNFLGYCISLFFVGGLADRYGRKPIILLGLVVFILGSFICLYPYSYPFLLLGRFLQGVGIASPAILSFLIIADAYPIKKQQFLIAMLNGSMNLAVAVAPVIGSYITFYFHWQGNFTALLFLGFITLIMTVFFIPHATLPQQKESLSLASYFPLFQSRPLLLLMISIVLGYIPYWVFVGMSPLLYMEGLGVDLSHFGYYQGILAFLFAIGSVIYGLVMNKFDHKKALHFSIHLFIVSLISLSLAAFTNITNPLLITLAFIPFVIGQIIPTTILYPLCLNYIPHLKGRISAVLQGSRLILAAIGLQIAGFYYQGSFQQLGIMISIFIFMVIVSLIMVMRNQRLMKEI